jgi:hypothetical protein
LLVFQGPDNYRIVGGTCNIESDHLLQMYT